MLADDPRRTELGRLSDDPRLRAVSGGTNETVARVMGHMIGLMFGLTQSSDETNLMAGGTTGTALDSAQIERLRHLLPAGGVTRAPSADQFLVLPLYAHVLECDIRALSASPELVREYPRIEAKINRIWSAAGIYFRLLDVRVVSCDGDAARRAFAGLDLQAQSKGSMGRTPASSASHSCGSQWSATANEPAAPPAEPPTPQVGRHPASSPRRSTAARVACFGGMSTSSFKTTSGR
jgi:hypothetical protein